MTAEQAPNETTLEAATELASRAPEPAVFNNVLFGTAGWTDPTLVKSGLFYPRGTKTAKDRLAHYGKHFGLVEVDATYYTILPPETAERWLENTPDQFVFDVKAHPVLTGHPVDTTRLSGDLRTALAEAGHEGRRVYPDKIPGELRAEMERRFRAFLQVLLDKDRLGALLLQFPPWFQSTKGNARAIESVASRLEGVPLSVEFRHRSWVEAARRDRVFDMLRAIGASYVVVDEPDVATGGVPAVVAVTNPNLAIVRFHGHNIAGWRKGTTVQQRFDYLYSPEELRAWVAPVKQLAAEAKKVHAVFNNCVRNYAVLDAKGLSVLLEEEGAEKTDAEHALRT